MGLSNMIIFRMREKNERIDREDEMGYFNEEDNEKDRKSERKRQEDYKIYYNIENRERRGRIDIK